MARPVRKIFISHAKQNEALAQVLVDFLLETLTIQDAKEILCTSLPGHELVPGTSPKEAIRAAIREAPIIIGLLTPQALERQAVMMELGAAWALEKEFMPLLYGVAFDRVPEWVQAQAVRLDMSLDDLRTLNRRAIPIMEEVSHQTGYPKKNHEVIVDATVKLFSSLKELLKTLEPAPTSPPPRPPLEPALATIVRRARQTAASLRGGDPKKGSLALASVQNVKTYNAWLEEAKLAGSTTTLTPLPTNSGIMPGLSNVPSDEFIAALEVLASDIEESPVKPITPPPGPGTP